jgi:hypothetical protein
MQARAKTGNESNSDGDGMSKLQELLAGTDPNSSASFFHIVSVVTTGSNVHIDWMTGIGKTNALERTAGVAGSFTTNNFIAIFTITSTVGTITNHLDIGAATTRLRGITA